MSDAVVLKKVIHRVSRSVSLCVANNASWNTSNNSMLRDGFEDDARSCDHGAAAHGNIPKYFGSRPNQNAKAYFWVPIAIFFASAA
jgi:hypothetical protein